jgi:putative exosortase-associated protein (TIGR04073 family)
MLAILLIIFLGTSYTTAFASEAVEGSVNKLERGLINTASCWAEVPGRVCEVAKSNGPVSGLTFGLVKGLVLGLLRGVTGLLDTVSFFAPPYDKPLMQPEYALQYADEQMQALFW